MQIVPPHHPCMSRYTQHYRTSIFMNLPAMQGSQETRVQSLGQKDPLEEGIATHCCILSWESHGQRSLAGYSPWGHKD